MSNYKAYTQHPYTREFSMAEWIDDYYGSHHYGVKFSNSDIFSSREHELEVRDFDERMYDEYCDWWKKYEPNPGDKDVPKEAYEELGRKYVELRASYNF